MLKEAKAYSSEELKEMRETMGPEADYLRGWSPRRWLATLAERDSRIAELEAKCQEMQDRLDSIPECDCPKCKKAWLNEQATLSATAAGR